MKIIDKTLLQKALMKVPPSKDVFPPRENILRAFELCEAPKVVFLGQDPYPQPGMATGIAFGNLKNTIKISPSLEIFKNALLNPEIPHDSVQFDCTLESWERQGVLLLNSALTVAKNKPLSHILIWNDFIRDVLKNLNNYSTGIIYVFFGNIAKTYSTCIDTKNNYLFFEKHPAYYVRSNLYMDNTLFLKINEILTALYGIKIKWYEN